MHTAPRADEVHLWRATLDVSPELATRFSNTLSQDEQQRVARLRRPIDASRYAAGHGWLRQLLAAYIETEPSALVFVAGTHGKPRLASPTAPWLRFNLAHSGGIVVFAVARDREVGVDVEEIREDVEIDGVSRRVFTARQCRELDALAPAERAPAFYTMWTRNEAYLKATGTGLGGAERDVDHQHSGWLLSEFDAGPGYAAAVAVEGSGVEVPPHATDMVVDEPAA